MMRGDRVVWEKGGEEDIPSRELSSTVTTLYQPEANVYLYIIGTAHVMSQSVEDVRRTVRRVRPGVCLIELDESRKHILLNPEDKAVESRSRATLYEAVSIYRRTGSFENVLLLLLSSFIGSVGSKFGVVVGAEFRAAFEEARDMKIPILLGDRPMMITLKRLWAMLSRWEKVRLIWHLRSVNIDDVNEKDVDELLHGSEELMVRVVEELRGSFPTIPKSLITERDMWLSEVIQNITMDKSPSNGPENVSDGTVVSGERRRIVAVVGRGHVEGIQGFLLGCKPALSRSQLIEIPKTPPFFFFRVRTILLAFFAICLLGLLYGCLRIWKIYFR